MEHRYAQPRSGHEELSAGEGSGEDSVDPLIAGAALEQQRRTRHARRNRMGSFDLRKVRVFC